MFKKLLLTGIVMLSFVPVSGYALITSKDLLDYCTTYVQVRDHTYTGKEDNETGVETGICLAYVVGVINMDTFVAESNKKEVQTETGGWALCLPDDVTGDQSADAVLKYLHDNPAEVNTPTAAMVVKALRSAYPCKS